MRTDKTSKASIAGRTYPALLALVLSLAAGRGARATPVFDDLGDLPGGSEYSVANGISPDGKYVVGGSSSANSGTVDQFFKPTEAFIWSKADGMIALGDLAGGNFISIAYAVTSDGNRVVGTSEEFRSDFANTRLAPFLWIRGAGMGRLGPGKLGSPTTNPTGVAAATAIAPNGSRVVGNLTYTDPLCFFGDCTINKGFVWESFNPPQTITFFSSFGRTIAAEVNSAGTIVGTDRIPCPGPLGLTFYQSVAFRWPSGGALIHIADDTCNFVNTQAVGVSADGKTIVGVKDAGVFLWHEGDVPPLKVLAATAPAPVGLSDDGRVILDNAGGMYLDGQGPFDLRQILADTGVIDLLDVPAGDFHAGALSKNGLFVVGSVVDGGITKAWRVQLTDCDGNGLPDELEQKVFGDKVSDLIAQGSARFSDQRESLGYGDMISQYGRPWKPGTNQTPARDPAQPAEFLRSALRLTGCVDGSAVNTDQSADRFAIGAGFPSVQELHNFEMLLGNEALADAMDPTIGLDGISVDDLGDQFAFKGLSGIGDLLDDELALLRGRELPGAPSAWLNETTYYPEYTGIGGDKLRVAVYNRLPPNAIGTKGVAYRSNYKVADNYEAAQKFPQGHGDAYGHYLSALKATIGFLRDGPTGWPERFLVNIATTLSTADAALDSVRQIAEAGAARAQAAEQIVDLYYRRDFKESPEDPQSSELFSDPDLERGWSMGQWAHRGALGAYLDWAVASHWAPDDPARPVNRAGLPELAELAAAAGSFQDRLDTAGAGLDPLGLLQNVVPFGIDASGLQPGSGHSHYEQVRDAANRALDNARKAFENANQAGQRLRDADQSLEDFTSKLEDTRADSDQELISVFGLPSADDPSDNDLDPSTSNVEESQSHPDLTDFLVSDEAIAAAGWRPRQAPGEVQLALTELKVASLKVEQAELAIDELSAQIHDQTDFLVLLAQVERDKIKIITQAGNEQMALDDRLKEIDERKKTVGIIGKALGGWIGAAATGNPADFFSTIMSMAAEDMVPKDPQFETEFDVEKERTRVQTWKEIQLLELDDKVQFQVETDKLKALIRKTPQLIVDRAVALEVAAQAVGRLKQAAEKGKLLLAKKNRLESRIEGQLLEERWKDMAFRMVRNASLKNFRAFFDVAARYVVLTARAYSYEFDARSDGEDVLSGIYRERRLGSVAGLGGGLQSVILRLDSSVTVNNFNRPLETLGEGRFSFRRNLLGIGVADFPNDDLRFRAWLESQIVDRVEDLEVIRDQAQISAQRDYGPAIVIPFATEIDGRNFFGQGPDQPFGNTNFSITRNAKIRNFALRFDGVDTSLGIDPEQGTVFVYLMPAGQSVLRENTNQPVIEDELAVPWAVVDQFLPPPPLAITSDFADRSYNPWLSGTQSGGNFLGAIKRYRDSQAQVELGQATFFNTNLAGRSAWNTAWLLVVPGSQWTASSDPLEIRHKLLQFIYGLSADPTKHVGITDIRLIIQAYSH